MRIIATIIVPQHDYFFLMPIGTMKKTLSDFQEEYKKKKDCPVTLGNHNILHSFQTNMHFHPFSVSNFGKLSEQNTTNILLLLKLIATPIMSQPVDQSLAPRLP